MNRRAVVLLAFLLVLYVMPTDLNSSYGPGNIVDNPYLTKDSITAPHIKSELSIGSLFYGPSGETEYLGNGTFRYTVHMGETNTWNGSDYLRYIYDPDNKQIQIGNLTFTHLPGGIVAVETFSGVPLVDGIHWYAQYYFNSIWNNFTFTNYEFVGFSETNDNVTTKQRWWSPQGELNVSYTFNWYREMKMRAKATNWAVAAVPVRIIWAALGISSILADYSPMIDNDTGTVYGVELGEYHQLLWQDVIRTTPQYAIIPMIDKPARRAAVVFGNLSSILAQNETMDIDPTYTLSADIDDCWWRWQSGIGWDIWAASNTISLTNQSTVKYYGQQRFQLYIQQATEIISANYYAYEEGDPTAGRISVIKRINETNVGNLETDISKPVIANITYATYSGWDAVGYEWTDAIDVTSLIQEQINLADWFEGYYIGFQWLWDSVYASGVYTLEDYQNPTRANNSYLVIEYEQEYDFVDVVSNLHSPADIGTHSAFAEEQDYDLTYDTLTEADSDTGTSTFGKTSGSGTSYRTTAANEVRLGVFTASSSGEVASIVFYGRGSSATNCKAIITNSSGYLLPNGVGAATAVSTSAAAKTLTYSAGSRPLVTSGTTYWIGMIWQAAGRVYYDSTTGATSRQDTTNSYTTPTDPTDAGSTTETWRLMYANVNNINYGVDLEVGWVGADYDETNEYLCIYGGTQDAENLSVDVWAGSWTNLISDLQAGWNNYSVSDYLTSTAFEIRFVDIRTAPDVTTASTWNIDAVLLHTWSIAGAILNIFQTLELSATTTTVESLSLTVTEPLELSATVAVAMTAVLSVLQIIGVAAVVSTQRTAMIMIFQTVTIASALSTVMSMSITVNEPLSLIDSVILNIGVGGEYSIVINELIDIPGAVSTVLNTILTISETIGLFDSVQAIINPAIVLILYALLPIGASTTITGGLEGLNIFYDLFFSANMWSYLGPMAIVVFGYFIAKKERILGVLWFVLECLFIAQYITLVAATPDYWWHIFILVLGGLFTCVYPLWDR